MDNLKKYLQEHKGEMDFAEPSDALWSKVEAQLPPKKKAGLTISWKKITVYAAAACLLMFIGRFIFPGTPDIKNNNVPTDNNNSIASALQSPNNTSGSNGNADASTSNTGREDGTIAQTTAWNEQHKENPSAPVRKHIANHSRMEDKEDPATEEANSNLTALFSFASLIDHEKARLNKMPLIAGDASYYQAFKDQFHNLDMAEKNIQHQALTDGLDDKLLDQLILIYQQKINVLKQLRNEVNKTNSRYLQSRPLEATETLNVHYLNI